MKIALIDPRTYRLPEEAFPSLGLGYLAAIAKQDGHAVTIFDLRLGDADYKKRYLNQDFDVIGITSTSFTFSEALLIAQSVRQKNSTTKIILGGPHVSIAMGEVFTSEVCEIGVFGEGEYTFRDLLAVFTQRTQRDMQSIPGIVYIEDGKKIQTSARPWIEDLDRLPIPDFTSLDIRHYTRYPIITSRGCPFKCIYCCCGPLWGKKWRFRAPENIVSEINYIKGSSQWMDRPFNILDDTFNLRPERVEAFCDLLLEEKLNITYYVWGFRADNAPMRMLKKMKESGCISVSLGVESANPEVLKRIKKGESITQITETIKNLKKVGIYPMCLFMIGNPGDTLGTVKETIRFARVNQLYLVAFNMALPYPKTDLWDYVEHNGHFLHKEYTKFHHYSEEPIFETPDFSARDRSKAFKLARRLERIQRLKFETTRKIDFVRRGDLRSLSWKKVGDSVRRTVKYFLDLVFDRVTKEKL